MTIPDTLRALLACPKCHRALRDGPNGSALDCPICGLRFPVREGIAVMLTSEAEQLAP